MRCTCIRCSSILINKCSVKDHFYLNHGKFFLDSAIKLLEVDEQNKFQNYLNGYEFNPHNLFICKKSYNLERAVKQISLSMKKMNTKINIVLAPACSSFDQFANFEERGLYFNKLVKDKFINR